MPIVRCPRPRARLRLLELEGRLAPAVFDVTLHTPGAGLTGDTAAVHAGGLTLTGGTPQAAGVARVTAPTAAAAVTAALSGAVQVEVGSKATTYTFGPTTASGVRADHKPYFVFLPDGRAGFVRLEDLAGTPNKADWDYNDRAWRVSVAPVGGITVGGGVTLNGGGEGGGYSEPTFPVTGSATLWDFYDQKATVTWTVTYPAPDRYHWRYEVTNHDLHTYGSNATHNKGALSLGIGSGVAASNLATDLPSWTGAGGSGGMTWSAGQQYTFMPGTTGVFEADTPPVVLGTMEADLAAAGRYATFAIGPVLAPLHAFKLHEVTFSGPSYFDIEADPGDPTYPGTPHWYDGDTNSLIDIDGDRSLPVGFVRNYDFSVAAKWVIDSSNIPSGTVEVSADGPGGYDIPWTEATVEYGLLVLPPTKFASPLANHIDYTENFVLNWRVRASNGTTPAGRSDNPVYVTLDTPGIAGPIFRTVVHISTEAADGVAERKEAIAKAWSAFEGLDIKKAPPAILGGLAGGPAVVDRKLYYYKEWDTKASLTPELLLIGDGQCGAFVRLFIDTVAMQVPEVLAGNNMRQIQPARVAEWMLIKDWSIKGATNLDPGYPYKNYLAVPGGEIFKKGANGWEYDWLVADGMPRRDLADEPGVRGQNTDNPKADFNRHYMAVIDAAVLYDVPYGKIRASVDAFETAAVFGYYVRLQQEVPPGGGAAVQRIVARDTTMLQNQPNLVFVDGRYRGYKLG